MRILDRYVLKSIIAIFIMTTLIFCFLYILIDSATNLDEILDRKIAFQTLVQYYVSYLPIIIAQTSAIASLIATLFTFSYLSSQNEIIALFSSGLNFWQITKPAICFGLLVSALVFGMNERFVPQAEALSRKIKTERMDYEYTHREKKKEDIKNLTFYGLKNRLYFIDTFDPNTYILDGITIISYDNQGKIVEKMVALQGKWTGIAWKFFRCHVTAYSQNISAPTKVTVYEEKLMNVTETPSPDDLEKQRLNVNAMNMKELHSYIQRFSDSGAKKALDNLRVDLYQKMAFPFGNIVIVLLGLPLALMTGRGSRRAQTFTSLGIAVGIGFLYYVCNAVGLASGKGGLIPPLLAAWLAPLTFSGTALVLINKKF